MTGDGTGVTLPEMDAVDVTDLDQIADDKQDI